MVCDTWTLNFDPKVILLFSLWQVRVRAVTVLSDEISFWYLACMQITSRWCVVYMYHVWWTLTMNFDHELWPQCQIIVFFMTSSCPGYNCFVLWENLLIVGMWVDHIKAMCPVPWLVTFDLELWPQGQIIVFFMTSLCPGCNCFVLWDGLL